MSTTSTFATRGAPLVLGTLMLLISSCVMKPREATNDAESDAGATAAGKTPGQGIQCGKDPTTGVTLCAGTTSCPDLVFDSNEFGGCGYRTVEPSFDLECVCNGTDLCPIGVAASCAEVADALAGKTLNDICNQVGTGTCRSLVDTPPKGGTVASGCDRACAIDCAGSPTCIQACPGC